MSVDISVIIPAYNAEKTLVRCLDSVLCQRSNLEVILIDDCSTDETLEVCKEYQSRYDNVCVIRNSNNIGQGLSRNVGIKKAVGRYLAFVDADDMISEYMFEDLFSLACAGDYDIVGCSLKEINEEELSKNNFDIFVNQLVKQRVRSVESFDKEGIESVLISALIGGVVEEPLEKVLPWSPCTFSERFYEQETSGVSATVTLPSGHSYKLENDGPAIPKKSTIIYRVTCAPVRGGVVKWQVTNTGEEALGLCPRGGFEKPNKGKTARRESTAYTGKHFVQCFVLRNGNCVRWSQPFFINVE